MPSLRLRLGLLVLSVFLLAAVLIGRAAQRDSSLSGCGRLGGSDIGIAGDADVLGYDEPTLDRYMSEVSASGASWFRVGIDWSLAEPERGGFDWSRSDRLLNAAVRHGLHPLVLLTYSPAWARAGGVEVGNDHGYPADPRTFGDFASAAASRYSTHAQAWEIWNEPNLVQFFAPAPDVAVYGSLLRAAYEAIHAVQPNATVISGGLAPAGDTQSNIAPVTFVDQLYRLGANRYLDAIGMHPYTYPALPTDPASVSYNAFQRMQLMRTRMVDGGDAAKAIWITEFGAPTTGSAPGVSEKAQADTLTEGIRLARQFSFVAKVFVYTLLDRGRDPTDVEQHFGLLRTDRTPKPAYLALQQITRQSCN